MSAIATYVAVGVFVFATGGDPDVKAVASPGPFQSMTACQEFADSVRAKAADAVADKDSPLGAFGIECVRVDVDAPKGS